MSEVIRTVGTGKDYATPHLAEADIDNIATSALGTYDLTSATSSIVFLIEPEDFSTDGALTHSNSVSGDSTYRVIYKSASAYPDLPKIYGSGFHGVLFNGIDTNVTLSGLEIHGTNTPVRTTKSCSGITVDSCVLSGSPAGTNTQGVYCVYNSAAASGDVGVASQPITVVNNVVHGNSIASLSLGASQDGSGGSVYAHIINNTLGAPSTAANDDGGVKGAAGTSNTLNMLMLNNIITIERDNKKHYDFTGSGTQSVSGAGNWAASGAAANTNWYLDGYGTSANATTDTTASSTDNQIVYVSGTGQLVNVSGNDAIGLGTTSGNLVPTTDIAGDNRVRNGFVDPGAFTTSALTIYRGIDSSGNWDYATFGLAEADLENIAASGEFGGAGTTLQQNNGAIVFNVSAGEYSETFYHTNTLYTSANNNVTYQASAGSEHNGVSGEGVRLIGNSPAASFAARVSNGDVCFSGITMVRPPITSGGRATISFGGSGTQRFEDCIIVQDTSAQGHGIFWQAGNGNEVNISVKNCLFIGNLNYAMQFNSSQLASSGAGNHVEVTNCTHLTHGFNRRFIGVDNDAIAFYDLPTTITNNVTNGRVFQTQTGVENPHPDVSAYYNAAAASQHVGASALIGGHSWTFTDDTTASSTGNQVIYTSSTGTAKLVNVSGNDVIGFGTSGSNIPSTDINGDNRVRDGFVDPGAFTTSALPIYRGIDSSGNWDYATFTLAEADVANIAASGEYGGSGTTLQQNNGAIVFNASAGTYSESVALFGTGLTFSANNNVTYQASSGSEHGGNFESGVNIIGSFGIQESFAVIDGLSVSPSTGGAASIGTGAVGAILRNLMSYSTNNRAFTLSRGGTASNPNVAENCVGKSDSSRAFDIRSDGAAESHWRVVNCTALATGFNQGFIIGSSSSGNTIYLVLVNNVVVGGTSRSYFESAGGTYVVTGSNNAGPDGSFPFPSGISCGGHGWTTTTDTTAASTGNQVVYFSSTGQMVNVSGNDAIGFGTYDSTIPTTDINGDNRVRDGFVDPGAFTTSALPVYRGIDSSGNWDYATFTLAEADVENIAASGEYGGSGTDFQQRNGAIVFNASAGTYNEIVDFNSTLTTSANNNVTYQASAGSEHGGVLGQGPYISGAYVNLVDNFTKLQGLSTKQISFTAPAGSRAVSCISGGEAYPGFNGNPGGTVAAPNVIENCVAVTNSASVYGIAANSDSGAAQNIRVTNSTVVDSAGRGISLTADAAQPVNAKLDNVLVLTTATATYVELGAGTVTTTGSNNFGGSTNPFPAGVQGSPYPITPTTSFSQALGAGDFAVYMGANGSLANVSGNDVWQQGVGPGSNSDVPTTDINGVARSGATANPGAFEADGFVAPTVTSATVGSASRDYATLVLAEADAETLAGTADFCTANVAVVFDVYADSTFTTGISLNILNSAAICDATRNVTYQRATSERPLRVYTGTDTNVAIKNGYTIWDGIDIQAASGTGIRVSAEVGSTDLNRVIVRNCEIACGGEGTSKNSLPMQKTSATIGFGTPLEPCLVENVVGRSVVSISQYAPNLAHTAGMHVEVINCTHLGDGFNANQAWNWALYNGLPSASFKIINCANLAQNASNDANITGGGVDVSGSTNNIGNAAASTPSFTFSSIGVGEQYTSTTDTTASSTGNQVVFVSSTGEMVNVSGNDAIGLGYYDSTIPSTDINGDNRVRDNQFVDPGAFTTSALPIYRGIDSSGNWDYATFTLAEADVENIAASGEFGGSGTTLQQKNGAIVFNASAGTYSENVTLNSTLTTSANNNVTYQVSSGSEHGGVREAGPYVNGSIDVDDAFTVIDGLSTQNSHEIRAQGVRFSNLLTQTLAGNARGMVAQETDAAGAQVVIENCVHYVASGQAPSQGYTSFEQGALGVNVAWRNCTIHGEGTFGQGAFVQVQQVSGDLTVELKNCINLTGSKTYAHIPQAGTGTFTITGSNNIGGSTDPFPDALELGGHDWTVTTDTTAASTGNQVVYVSSTGEMVNVSGNDAIGFGTYDSTIPTTDINGDNRVRDNQFVDAGAFTTSALPIYRGIDSSGNWDYATFTLAEADVENIAASGEFGGSGTTLQQRNGAIVFNASAGTYTGQFTPDSTLTTSANNNVTYQASAGSEHGGDKDSGVILTDTTLALYLRDDFTRIEGLVLKSTSTNNTIATDSLTGWVLDSCIVVDDSATGQSVTVSFNPSPDASNPVVLQNCLVFATGSRGIAAFGVGGYVRWSNNTVSHTGYEQTYRIQNTTLTLEAYNNFGVGGNGVNLGTATVTGAGNINGNGDQWPTGISAGNQTWTATTDTTASSTGNQVVYVSSTGRMVNVSGNDAIGLGYYDSTIPTTDVAGDNRVRDNQFVDVGAFTTSALPIYRGIDSGGNWDYATFTLAEADVENITASGEFGGSGTTLQQNNGAIVFNASAGTYNEAVELNTSLTTSANNNVTFQASSGSEHLGVSGQGPIINNTTGSFSLHLADNFGVASGLTIQTAPAAPYSIVMKEGCKAQNCIIDHDGNTAAVFFGDGARGSFMENCLVNSLSSFGAYAFASTGETTPTLTNNTFLPKAGNTQPSIRTFQTGAGATSATLNNNLVLSGSVWTESGGTTLSGTNNVAGPTNPLPTALLASSTDWTFTSEFAASSTGNQVIYWPTTGKLSITSGNDAWKILTDLTDVPATDIAGTTREASGYNPGAYEESAVRIPDQASASIPASGSVYIGIEQDLSWASSNYADSYDVHFGTATNPPIVSFEQAGLTYDPGTLSHNTTYYWIVDAVGDLGVTTSGVEWTFTTAELPDQATGHSPASGTIDVTLSATPSWDSIANASAYDVYFGTASTPPLVSQDQAGTTYAPGYLTPDTTYYWTVNTVGYGGYITSGVEQSFTTIGPPAQAANPSPASGAFGVLNTVDPAWDAASNASAYDVYFGTASTPPLVSQDQPGLSYNPGILAFDTLHYWTINAVGEGGVTSGVEWSFTTIEEAPDPVTNPFPANGASGVSISDDDPSWSSSTRATSYDVYFGTTNPPPRVSVGQTELEYEPGELTVGTTYYWVVNPIGLGGTTSGTTWAFSTSNLPAKASGPSPASGATAVAKETTLSWASATEASAYDVSFGTSYPPPLVSEDQPGLTYDPGFVLDQGTTYYWGVDTRNNAGETLGDDWYFITVFDPTDPTGGTNNQGTEVVIFSDSIDDVWDASANVSRNRYFPTREGDIRARIFKMTQQEHDISYVYRDSLRSMIASFNDIVYIDAEEKQKSIPVFHANAERAIAKLKQENNIILPIITITQTTSADDDDRRRYESVLVNERYWDDEKKRAYRLLSLAPRPVNISYNINVWTKYNADMDQILEQIRLRFNPEMNVPTQQSTLAKAYIEAEDDTGSNIATDKEDRIIQRSISVTLRTYVENPKFLVTSTGKIEKFIIITEE